MMPVMQIDEPIGLGQGYGDRQQTHASPRALRMSVSTGASSEIASL